MKVYAGRTFVYPDGGIPHLWVVVTEPSGNPADVAIVSLSSDRPGKDDTVKLAPGDHPFIRKPTVVFYPDTRLMPVQTIINEVTNGQRASTSIAPKTCSSACAKASSLPPPLPGA